MSFTVRVKMVPGGTEEVNSENPISVREAIERANVVNPSSFSPKIGGADVEMDKMLSADTNLFLIKTQIKGNR